MSRKRKSQVIAKHGKFFWLAPGLPGWLRVFEAIPVDDNLYAQGPYWGQARDIKDLLRYAGMQRTTDVLCTAQMLPLTPKKAA